MQFMLTPDWGAGASALSARLLQELQNGRKVLWLTSGGSNIAASVSVMASLPHEVTVQLTVMPGDERYGESGHADSNFQALLAAGFDAKQAKLVPILENGKSFLETAGSYDRKLHNAFAANDITIAQFGIGEDGHICGILPHSPAAEGANDLIVAYRADDYARLTMSFTTIRRLSVVFVLAYGGTKQNALHMLKHENLPLNEQPAQILKDLKEAYVYNDQIGGDET